MTHLFVCGAQRCLLFSQSFGSFFALPNILGNLGEPPCELCASRYDWIFIQTHTSMLSMYDVFPYATLRTHNTLPTHHTSTHSNTTDISLLAKCTTPSRTQVQMHAYGLNYLSPYKNHSSISAPEVGHCVFKHITFIFFFPPLHIKPTRTDYVTLHIQIPFSNLRANDQLH